MHLWPNGGISNSLPYSLCAVFRFGSHSVVHLLHCYIDSVGYVGITNVKYSPPTKKL